MAIESPSLQRFVFPRVMLGVLVVGISLLIFHSLRTARVVSIQALTTLRRTVEHVTDHVDDHVERMERLSLTVAHSALIRETFLDFAAEADDAARYPLTLQLQSQIEYLLAPELPVFQVNLYTLNGLAVGSGYYQLLRDPIVEDQIWYAPAIDAGGSRVLSPPQPNPSLTDDDSTISLARTYRGRTGEWLGFIEIEQKTDEVFGFADEYFETDDGEAEARIVISDAEDNVVFDSGTLGGDEQDRIVEQRRSDYTGYVITVEQSRRDLLRPLRVHWIQTLGISSLLVVIALAISRLVAIRVARPIGVLSGQLSSLEFSAPPTEVLNEAGGVKEVDQLRATFNQMLDRWRISTDQVILSRTRESEARLQALQAHVNPHFLCNSLTHIAIMARDGNPADVEEACHSLSEMFRYVSSDNSREVTIREDMDYLRRYLLLMRIRYEDNVDVSIDVSAALDGVLIPRLTLQPLVDNIFKHGQSDGERWTIRVHGRTLEDRWFIAVEDRGPGFAEEMLGVPPTVDGTGSSGLAETVTRMSGLGLRNTALRLRSMYGDASRFSLENRIDGGARVVIGGRL